MNSNRAQTEAICHKDGPMLVLAGPGSGKTYVITNRVKNLIEEGLVPPEEILVITFSRMAAAEMKERFDRLTERAYPGVTFGTFHACFFHMLQYARGYGADSILRESDALTIMGEILTSIRPEYAEDRALVRDVCEEVLKVKCLALDSTSVEFRNYKPSSCDAPTFRTAYGRYAEQLRRLRKVDFEDMLLETRELLLSDPSALSFWQARYRYLLIDEFQDVNRLQYEIVRLLAGGRGNLFAVGDDDQSIYGFRGSEPQIMQEMPRDFPGCRVITLPVNYRSTPEIVSAADALISCNTVRYEKKHTTSADSGDAVRMLRYETVASENAFLLSEIASLTKAGCPFREIAVLFRTNLQMRSLSDALGRAGVPFYIRGFLPSLYDNPQVRTVLAYLRAAHGDMSRRTVLAIANQPKRYLERRLLTDDVISLPAVRAAALCEGKKYLADNIDRLIYDLAMLRKMNPFAAIHYIRKVIGLDAHVTEHSLRGEDALDILEEFQEAAHAYETVPLLFAAVEEESRKASDRRRAPDKTTENGVALMTFHASKGLEFDHVYICDCNDTIVPHKKALLPEAIEEERRLLYVAMTRARRTLSLLYVQKRFGKELPPSGFLGEILLPASGLTPGTRVSHRQFGEGTVLSLAGDKLQIRFDRFAMPKTLSHSLCARSMLLQVIREM
ncbi:MAG: ATP-dependent helicase [Lachnospiraceae bacterium]|nr:ATP-dependent helicase [Lachnospiraceae bacterium]